MSKVGKNVALETEDVIKLQKIADNLERSFSWVVQEAVGEYLRREIEK